MKRTPTPNVRDLVQKDWSQSQKDIYNAASEAQAVVARLKMQVANGHLDNISFLMEEAEFAMGKLEDVVLWNTHRQVGQEERS